MAEEVRDNRRGNDDDDDAWEIEEVAEWPSPLAAPAAAPPAGQAVADDVYVAVGKGGSSMAALLWALRRLASPRSFVYLVHVFPDVATIPTPCKQPWKPSVLVLDDEAIQCDVLLQSRSSAKPE